MATAHLVNVEADPAVCSCGWTGEVHEPGSDTWMANAIKHAKEQWEATHNGVPWKAQRVDGALAIVEDLDPPEPLVITKLLVVAELEEGLVIMKSPDGHLFSAEL